MRRVWPESNSATSFNRCKTRCGSRSIARSGHPEEVENGSFQRGGEYCACALSGPCRAVVLCASQNDLPDDAPRNLSRTLRRQPAYFIELFPLNLVGRIQAWVAG